MNRQRQAELFLVLTTLIAACGWIFSREAISGMPVFAFLGLRFLGAALVLLPFCRGQAIPRAQLRQVVTSGFWMATNMCLWIWSVSTTPSLGEGAFIMSLSMLFVPLVAWAMMGVRPAPIVFHPSQGWFLLTAFVQSISFCYTSRVAREVPLIPLTTVQLAVTGAVGVLFSLLFEHWTQPFTASTAMWLVASIFIATSLRFGLQIQGQKYAAVASAALIMVLEPLLTVIAASLWYSERLPLQKILGGVLILLAQLWFRWRLVAKLPSKV